MVKAKETIGVELKDNFERHYTELVKKTPGLDIREETIKSTAEMHTDTLFNSSSYEIIISKCQDEIKKLIKELPKDDYERGTNAGLSKAFNALEVMKIL